MRTTVTLDPDTEQLVKRLMRERGVSFKAALNDAIRAAAPAGAVPTPFRTTTVSACSRRRSRSTEPWKLSRDRP